MSYVRLYLDPSRGWVEQRLVFVSLAFSGIFSEMLDGSWDVLKGSWAVPVGMESRMLDGSPRRSCRA